MQIFVLGIQHSGARQVSRLLNLMGVSFDPSRPAPAEVVWESAALGPIHDRVLDECIPAWHASARTLSDADAERFREDARRVIADRDHHRPWAVSESRLSFAFKFWRPLLEAPLCVFAHRPVEEVVGPLSFSLEVPMTLAAALWEAASREAAATTSGLPRVVVSIKRLREDPDSEVDRLVRACAELGLSHLRTPSDAELAAIVEGLAVDDAASSLTFVPSEEQAALAAAFEDDSILDIPYLAPLSHTSIDLIELWQRVLPSALGETADIGASDVDSEHDRYSALAERHAELTAELEKARLELGMERERVRVFEKDLAQARARIPGFEAELKDAEGKVRSEIKRRREVEAAYQKCKKKYRHAQDTVSAMEHSKTWKIGKLIASPISVFRRTSA
jgi:hypothetical protein